MTRRAGQKLRELLVAIVRECSGSHRIRQGGDGEQNTAAVLRSLERSGWRVIHDIAFDGFHVDHVAVGPSGAYAIETKTTSARWGLTSTRDGQYLAEAIDQARFGARKIRLLLSEMAQVDVKAILICWGWGIGELGDEAVVHGEVLVVAGRKAGEMMRAFEPEVLDPVDVDSVAERLETYVRS